MMTLPVPLGSPEINFDRNWTNPDGTHDGGVATGIGYTISWQRGPLLENGRNGAFLLDVLAACYRQLLYCECGSGDNLPVLFSCEENKAALAALEAAIDALRRRRDRRKAEGILGTTQGR